jgi:hypothetical protein
MGGLVPLVTATFGNLRLNEVTPESIAELKAAAGEMEILRMKMLGQGNDGFNLAGDVVKEFKGVILGFNSANVMFKYERQQDVPAGEKNLPICCSWNGVDSESTSTERQAAKCQDCKMNAYGTAKVGRGKRCKNMKRVWVLPEDSFVPLLWSIPPTSIQMFGQFITKIMARGLRASRVVVLFKTRTETAGENKISIPELESAGVIDTKDEKLVLFLETLRGILVPIMKQKSEGKV